MSYSNIECVSSGTISENELKDFTNINGKFVEVNSYIKAKENNSIYVGDSGSDMLTAQNAHIKSIGVTWGFRDAKSLLESGADFLIDSPKQLLEIIESENCIKTCN